VAFDIDQVSDVNIIISDVLGKTSYMKDFGKMNAGKNQKLNLDISTLKPGIYFITINSNEQRFVRKLMVQ